MKRLMYRFVCVAAMAASMAMLAQTSAYATGGPGGFVLAGEGGGFITPGLTNTPTFQSGTFSGTFVGVAAAATLPTGPAAAAVGVGNCNFTFSSTIAETAQLGQGTASGSCTVALVGHFTVSPCTIDYRRVGVVVVLTIGGGSCTINVTIQVSVPPLTGTASNTADIGAGVFLFAPTTGNGVTSPVTAYALAGVGATLSDS